MLLIIECKETLDLRILIRPYSLETLKILGNKNYGGIGEDLMDLSMEHSTCVVTSSLTF